jgi:uncharacterized RDD family membrane protein YckC
VVHSPERYRLELPLAGPTSRILAYAIDWLVIIALQVLLVTMLFLLSPWADSLQGTLREIGSVAADDDGSLESWGQMILGFLLVTQLVVEWVYFVFLELTTGGRSVGKAIVKLRVVGDGAHPLRPTQSIARNLLRAVDILPGGYAVGLIAMIALDEGKRLGDLAAGTIVIRLDRPSRQAPIEAPEPAPGAEVFRFDHAQIARLGGSEQRLIRQTLRRLPDLPTDQAQLALERTTRVIAERIEHEPVPIEQRESFLRALLDAAERR